MRGSSGGGEDLSLSGSSLDGGFGLTPFTYVVVGRVTVEKAVLVDSGDGTFVSEKISRKHQTVKDRREEKTTLLKVNSNYTSGLTAGC